MAYGSVNVPGARMATLGTDGKLEGAQRPSLAEIKGGSNPNLLRNWYFPGPVNQNGKTEYTTTANRCTIDGWKSRDSNGIVTLTDDGLKLSGIRCLFLQNYDKIEVGTDLTFSALVKGPVSIAFHSANYGNANNIGNTTNEWVLLYITGKVTNRYDFAIAGVPTFWNASGENISNESTTEDCWVKAVKLELGTRQTLAHKEGDTWVLNDPPDYALQYALCSQYSPITGEFVGSQQSNPNLLDNARWDKNAYIINQMGYTKWTSAPKPETGADANTKYGCNPGTYSIDRWILQSIRTAELVANGFKLTCQPSSSNLMLLEQKIENLDLSSPYTISVLISDIDGPANVWRVRGCAGPNYTIPTAPGLYSYTVTNPAGGDIYFWRIPTEEECSITISAVKIERGYVQTLAHKEGDTWVLNDPPPNKALELAKCQRYQFNVNNDLSERFCAGIGNGLTNTLVLIDIPLPTPLRAKPAITFSGNWFAVPDTTYVWNKGIPVTSIALNQLSNNFATVNVTVEDAVVGTRYRLVSANAVQIPSSLLLDANL